MKTIKTVGIKDLKNQLSAYLRDVNAGMYILITDRGKVVAELHKPTIEVPVQDNLTLKLEWIENGKLVPPKVKKKKCVESPVKLQKATSGVLLDEERGCNRVSSNLS